VGIDLGTTNSLIATVRSGEARCLPDEQGRLLLPSVVRYLDAGRREIGFAALAHQTKDPANTIASVKRLMGRSLADLERVASLPYALVDAPGMVHIRTVAGDKSPVEVSAEILATLRFRAEDTLGDDVFGAVVTVPAYFDDAQRQATLDAARLAGINVLRLINEPTAAAIAYGLDNAAEGVFAVYDLGGGTFDVSLLRLSEGVFEVLATGGDTSLGGDDYDRALAELLQEQAGLPPLTAVERSVLMTHARRCKELLSQSDLLSLEMVDLPGAPTVEVNREQFENVTRSLTGRTVRAMQATLRDAGLDKEGVDGVVLVGGATRMPQVRKVVADFFQKAPLTNLNPDEVVALGAAIQANQLAGNGSADDLLLLDVIPLSLGVETMGGLVERIVPRNQTIPIAMAQDFTTFKDGQTALALHVVQGERDLVADCRSLARFELRGIPPMAAGAARIRVTFTVDADGLLSVSATEINSGVHAQIEVKPSFGLTDDRIAAMLKESFVTAQADMQARALTEARVDAQRMLMATQSAIEADSDLLDPYSRAQIEVAVQALMAASSSDDAALIEERTKILASATEAFAAQRMNRGIAGALTGRNVETI
jgi:molecular chaperone HscA